MDVSGFIMSPFSQLSLLLCLILNVYNYLVVLGEKKTNETSKQKKYGKQALIPDAELFLIKIQMPYV